jgi:flagellar biosynthesis protein FlhG
MNKQAEDLIRLWKKKKFYCKVLSVSSGKGGVGKTNFSVNFAYALTNLFSKKVLLIDADIGLGNVHLLINANPSKTMRNILQGQKIESIIQRCHNFDVLLGFSGINDLNEIDEINVPHIINQLSRISYRYDYIIIDTSAGLDSKVLNFLRNSDISYIITTPEPTSLTDAYALIKTLKSIYGYSKFRIIVNMYKSKSEALSTFEKLEYACAKFINLKISLAGIIPYSRKLKDAVKQRDLMLKVDMHSPFSEAVTKIARKELGTSPSAEKNNFWKKLFGVG